MQRDWESTESPLHPAVPLEIGLQVCSFLFIFLIYILFIYFTFFIAWFGGGCYISLNHK